MFSKKETPTTQTYPVLDTNNIGDICSALTCLIGYAVYFSSSEDPYGSMFVTFDNDNRTTSIYASGGSENKNWIKNSKDMNEYSKINVPKHIAEFLGKIPFENNGGGGPLKITFDSLPSSSLVKRKIEESRNLMPPYSDLYFKIKAYTINGTNKFQIDLDILKD